MGPLSTRSCRSAFLLLLVVCLVIFHVYIIEHHHYPKLFVRQNTETGGTLYPNLQKLQIEINETFHKFDKKRRFTGRVFDQAVEDEEDKKNEKHYLISRQTVPRLPDCKQLPFLLVQVHSTPENVMEREAIRMSWGRPENKINKVGRLNQKSPRLWRTVFLLGQTLNPKLDKLLQDEASINGDMVFGNFIDSYRNLTLKMAFGIEWAAKHCQAEYVMKVDEDSFVNIHELVLWLDEHQRRKSDSPLYMGAILITSKPVRELDSKYYVSVKEYPHSRYPPYALGPGYVFSGDLLVNLSMALKIVKLFPNEDACFGVLMRFLKVKLTYNERFLPFTMGKVTYWDLQGHSLCKFVEPLVIHRISGKQQIQTHFNVLVLKHVPTICQHIKSGIYGPDYEVEFQDYP
ncbi:beta-1,3-galactosyltransferase 5-like [Montipora foliosa]|uniref:beta-1,3-galactosyltransferase 5-like n=1 Tax=Montipora foliosa TaxID=591990 RepID=UPI0035F1E9DA